MVRLRSRVNDKIGLVKVSFQSVEQKIEVLCKKRDFMISPAKKSVFLRSSKSHTERVIELHAKNQLKSDAKHRSNPKRPRIATIPAPKSIKLVTCGLTNGNGELRNEIILAMKCDVMSIGETHHNVENVTDIHGYR